MWWSSSRDADDEQNDASSFVGNFKAALRNTFIASSSLKKSQKDVPSVWISNRQPLQGETVAIRVSVPRPRTPVGHLRHLFHCSKVGRGLVNMTLLEEDEEHEERFGNQGESIKSIIPVFRDDDTRGTTESNLTRWCGYIPSTPLDRPGRRLLVVRIEDGRHHPRTMELRFRKRPFDTQSIWLDDDKAELLGGCGAEESMRVEGSLRVASPARLWRGGFLRPCCGPVTTEYGVSRTYNGVPRENYFHAGVDYGAPHGAPVVSPADGRVVLVGEENEGFPYHGTCVTVDHGHGVTSLLMHLSAVHVQNGDVVRAGQRIGRVGSTGIATGPHLHWGLHVSGNAVDPTPWLVD